MHWRYAHAASSSEQAFRTLVRLFRQLLLIFDGDVELSLDHLEEIGTRYRLWREDLGIDDFRRWLEARGEVRADGRDNCVSRVGASVRSDSRPWKTCSRR